MKIIKDRLRCVFTIFKIRSILSSGIWYYHPETKQYNLRKTIGSVCCGIILNKNKFKYDEIIVVEHLNRFGKFVVKSHEFYFSSLSTLFYNKHKFRKCFYQLSYPKPYTFFYKKMIVQESLLKLQNIDTKKIENMCINSLKKCKYDKKYVLKETNKALKILHFSSNDVEFAFQHGDFKKDQIITNQRNDYFVIDYDFSAIFPLYFDYLSFFHSPYFFMNSDFIKKISFIDSKYIALFCIIRLFLSIRYFSKLYGSRIVSFCHFDMYLYLLKKINSVCCQNAIKYILMVQKKYEKKQ